MRWSNLQQQILIPLYSYFYVDLLYNSAIWWYKMESFKVRLSRGHQINLPIQTY